MIHAAAAYSLYHVNQINKPCVISPQLTTYSVLVSAGMELREWRLYIRVTVILLALSHGNCADVTVFREQLLDLANTFLGIQKFQVL